MPKRKRQSVNPIPPRAMATNKLPKVHRLCSKTAIDRLFSHCDPQGGGSALAYPLRAVWAPASGGAGEDGTWRPPLKFLISIPKKRLRHAVDRVLMRRRVREAYRLARPEKIADTPQTPRYDVAFIYVADKIEEYARVNTAVRRLLKKIYPPA